MTAKACSMACVLNWSVTFAWIGWHGTSWVENGNMRLLWVMIVTPGIMNTFYFWTADEFLRHEVEGEPRPPAAQAALIKAEATGAEKKSVLLAGEAGAGKS